jgi:hypothetical protein
MERINFRISVPIIKPYFKVDLGYSHIIYAVLVHRAMTQKGKKVFLNITCGYQGSTLTSIPCFCRHRLKDSSIQVPKIFNFEQDHIYSLTCMYNGNSTTHSNATSYKRCRFCLCAHCIRQSICLPDTQLCLMTALRG